MEERDSQQSSKTKQAARIQTSILNPAEKKVLVWLAERQPGWMTSNYLTFIGVFGALLTGLGYAMTIKGMGWLWLANLGFLVNWYGDSLARIAELYSMNEKTVATYLFRVRKKLKEYLQKEGYFIE